VIDEADPNVVRSCRNLRNLNTTLAHQLNPYELLRSEALLVTASGLARMKEVFVR
jgi:ribosomal protein L4